MAYTQRERLLDLVSLMASHACSDDDLNFYLFESGFTHVGELGGPAKTLHDFVNELFDIPDLKDMIDHLVQGLLYTLDELWWEVGSIPTHPSSKIPKYMAKFFALVLDAQLDRQLPRQLPRRRITYRRIIKIAWNSKIKTQTTVDKSEIHLFYWTQMWIRHYQRVFLTHLNKLL